MGNKLQTAKSLYLEGIRDGDLSAVERYTGDTYIQHSTNVRDGKEGFLEFFKNFVATTPQRDIQILRGMEDGNYTFVHAYQDLGTSEWVTMDFFRYDEEGKIVEHWDTINRYEGKANPQGNNKINGATELKDLDKTEENKALVRNLLKNALMREGDPSTLDQYISSEKYIQHNPEVPDGLAAFQALATAPNRPLNYEDVVLMVGEGNFVATLSRATWKDSEKDAEYAQIDLFRVEDGKVVEHWDNVEKVLPKEKWVNGGKF